jgi:hypothetical protein
MILICIYLIDTIVYWFKTPLRGFNRYAFSILWPSALLSVAWDKITEPLFGTLIAYSHINWILNKEMARVMKHEIPVIEALYNYQNEATSFISGLQK